MAARLSAGTTLTLRVRSGGTVQDLALVAAAATPPVTEILGLSLRARARTGAEVVAVAEGSAGERAGLAAADVVTLIGTLSAPTPGQVTRAFAALRPGERVLVAVSRGAVRFVTTLERAR